MKKLLLLITLGLSVFFLSAQEEAIFNHYLISPILVNPAAAGFNDEYQLQFNARAQWTGFADAPKNLAARVNGPVGRTFGLGVGIASESAAQLNRYKVQLDYAFRFGFGREYMGQKETKVAFGFYTSFQRMTIDNSITEGPFYDPADETLENMLDGEGEFDAAFGVFGTFRENTYGGLTINNLVSNRLDNIAGTGEAEGIFSYYTLLLGHRFILDKQGINIEPSVLLRQLQNTPFQADVNVKAGFLNDQLIAGLSYRSLGAVGLLVGTKLNNFNLYYGYDLSFQEFQRYNSGSHEVMIALSLDRSALKRRRE